VNALHLNRLHHLELTIRRKVTRLPFCSDPDPQFPPEETMPRKTSPQETPSRPGSSLSLRPDQILLDAYVEGNEIAVAIVESWKFNHPVLVLPANDPLWRRIGEVTFGD
jgi:hypothetical protein